MQADRLEAVVQDWERAVLDARMRANLNEDTENSRAWRESYDAHKPYDPQRPIRVPTFALSAQVANELDLFVVAVRNVLRAQDRLPADLRPEMTDERLFELTRNIAEHWDEIGGRSADAFANEYPGRVPGQISSTNKEVFVSEVPLSRVVAWLARVNQALKKAIEDAGQLVPDDEASVVEGDDDLPWPSERRRERLWQVRQLDMDEWPTEEMPEEIAELLQRRFQHLRERDGAE